MSCVADDETNVVSIRELHRSSYLLGVGSLDRVVDVVSESARPFLSQEWVTALIGEELLHYRRRRFDTFPGC